MRKSKPVRPAETPDGPALDHDALDTLAVILRSLAQAMGPRHPQRAEDLQHWARHVLVLAPPPGWTADPPTHRLWPQLRSATVLSIRDEFGVLSRSLGDLQDVVWSVIEQLGRVIAEEAVDGDEASRVLDQLRNTLLAPPDELREIVEEAVGVLGRCLDGRRSRHEELASSLTKRISTLSTELEQVRREAEVDALTQVANRGAFDRELARAVHLRGFVDEPVILGLIDIDRFKEINDRHGHGGGDEALRVIARELTRVFSLRSDIVARYGGDEFAVILPRVGADDAVRLAGRFLARLKGITLRSAQGEFRLSTSLGMVEIIRGMSASTALAAADTALYAAKAGGRNQVVLATKQTA